MTYKVGVIGSEGWVGRAMVSLFPEATKYDEGLNVGSMDDVNKSDIAFVAVPTPSNPDGSLDMSIVEDVVSKCNCQLIIIRSTLQPRTCDYLEKKYGKNICFQAEYLGETPNHPLLDETKRQFLVIGGKPENRRKLIELYTTVYNSNITIRQLTNYEAEICKLTENRAIGFKVMQLHELYEACEKAGIDYYTIRDTVYGDDPRFDLWFSFIYPNNLGFESSKCLKKDIPGWVAWAESVGYNADITKLLIKKSEGYEQNRISHKQN